MGLEMTQYSLDSLRLDSWIEGDHATAFASKPAPTGDFLCRYNLWTLKINCGSELARDER
ncbi:hypothetical protein EMIT0P228_20139 [Pseudomonas brassicacearum]